MKSYSQIFDKNSSAEESLIFQNQNNNRKNKRNVSHKNRNSYSSLTTDTNNDKKVENEDYVKLKLSLKLNDEIDYSKKIRQAKEIEDLKKIYEKWSGQRFNSSNKNKNSDENEFIWLKKKNKRYNDIITNLKRKEDAKKYYNINNKYKNLLSENKRMKEELNKIRLQLTQLNKSKEKEIKKNKFLLEKLTEKPNIINLKKNTNTKKKYLLFSPKKKDNVFDEAKKIVEENRKKAEIEKARLLKAKKLEEELKKLKNKKKSHSSPKKTKKVTFNEKEIKEQINKRNEKNKSFSFVEKKQNEKEEKKIKNKKIILDEKKIKDEVNKINKKNKSMILTKKIQKEKENENENNLEEEIKIKKELKKLNEKNKIVKEKQINIDRALLEKNKNKLNKEEISENKDESIKDKLKNKENGKQNEIKITENNDKEEKIKLKLKLINSMKKENKPKVNNIDLKALIKKSNILSDKNNGNDNLVEKLDFVLELNKYLKNEIQINKNNNLLLPEEAVYYIENVIIRFLGYFGSELKLRNINTYIEKNPTHQNLRDITFKVILCGLATQKIYKIVIENHEIKEELSNNIDKYVEFLEDIKFKIAKKFNISENNIFFFGDNFKNFEIYLIIYNQNIDKVENLLKECNLKVTTSSLLNNVILSSNVFEHDYSKDINDWPKKNLMRGKKQYNPPYGWIGIGLKIKNKYGKKNNLWIGKENIEGEWPVAYHGVGKGNIFNRILNIINGDLDNEEGKLFKKEKNVEKNNDKYPLCGEGVYLSPNIEEAAYFADETSLGFFNVKFKFVFMTRVNPNKIRSPGSLPVHWILNGNKDEIRPYRLLIKIV